MAFAVWAIVPRQPEHPLVHTPVAEGEVAAWTAVEFSKAEDGPFLTPYTTVKEFPDHDFSPLDDPAICQLTVRPGRVAVYHNFAVFEHYGPTLQLL
jgi:hypothetical protein